MLHRIAHDELFDSVQKGTSGHTSATIAFPQGTIVDFKILDDNEILALVENNSKREHIPL